MCVQVEKRFCLTDHKRHLIDNLDDFHREINVQMKAKVNDAGKVLEQFGQLVPQTDFNKKLLRQNGIEIYRELDRLVEKVRRKLEDKQNKAPWKIEFFR